MSFFKFLNKYIQLKVAFFVALLIISMTLVLYVITLQVINKNISNEIIKRAEGLSRSMAVSAGYNFLSNDLLGLDNIVFKIKSSNSDVQYIAIVNNDNEIFAHSDVKKVGEILNWSEGPVVRKNQDGTTAKEVRSANKTVFEIVSPIISMNRQFGSVVLGINQSVLRDAQNTIRKRILGIFFITLIIGIIGSVVLSSFITRPIKELSSGVDEMKKVNRSRPLMVYSQDELGRLTESFNEMAAKIIDQREKLTEFTRDLEESYVSTVKVLAAALDARDSYTHGHVSRVCELSAKLAREINLGNDDLDELSVACVFHDIGKLKIPDNILRKKGSLTKPEREEIMRHPFYGEEILQKAPSLHKYIPAVRHHHEWYNGTGYPDGLTGDSIPLFAAIISITDVFDALTSDRPYRKAIPPEAALQEMIDLSGKQFRPDLVDLFVKIVRENIT